MKIKHLIEQLVLEELEKYKIGGDSAIPAGPVKLYHISDTEGIKRFDPNVAAKGKKGYSKREYQSWEQPRVFFFTEKGQTDAGIGRATSGPGAAASFSNRSFRLIRVRGSLANGVEKPEARAAHAARSPSPPTSAQA